jgi:hypothetical protein
VKRGLVTCPVCNSGTVAKQIMAPRSGARAGGRAAAAPEPQPVVVLSEKEREMRAMLKAFREHVTKTAENVGERFADEARKMHTARPRAARSTAPPISARRGR